MVSLERACPVGESNPVYRFRPTQKMSFAPRRDRQARTGLQRRRTTMSRAPAVRQSAASSSALTARRVVCGGRRPTQPRSTLAAIRTPQRPGLALRRCRPQAPLREPESPASPAARQLISAPSRLAPSCLSGLARCGAEGICDTDTSGAVSNRAVINRLPSPATRLLTSGRNGHNAVRGFPFCELCAGVRNRVPCGADREVKSRVRAGKARGAAKAAGASFGSPRRTRGDASRRVLDTASARRPVTPSTPWRSARARRGLAGVCHLTGPANANTRRRVHRMDRRRDRCVARGPADSDPDPRCHPALHTPTLGIEPAAPRHRAPLPPAGPHHIASLRGRPPRPLGPRSVDRAPSGERARRVRAKREFVRCV